MSSSTHFRIRDAKPGDDDANYITAAFDSTLPHLASIGSSAQWGSDPFSNRQGFHDQRIQALDQAEKYRLTGEGDEVRILIIEAKSANSDDSEYVPVGSSTLRGEYLSSYIHAQKHLEHITTTAKNFLFLEILVTDFRVGALRKGAGAALVQHAKDWAMELGKDVMFVDCWAGNDGKLVSFYEGQGFTRVSEFFADGRDGLKWPGMFLRMDLKE